MAIANKSIDPVLIKCAKEEFLLNGYNNTSMNVICKRAGITTGALFKRYSSKEDLFYGVVGNSINKLKSLFINELTSFSLLTFEEQSKIYSSSNYYLKALDIIYDNYDDFKIIIDRSSLVQYSAFLDYFVELETKFTMNFIRKFDSQTIIHQDTVHILKTGYFNGIFEVVRHNFKKTDAAMYIQQLHNFYSKGWENILNTMS